MLEVTLTSATGRTYVLTGSERTSRVLSPMGSLTTLVGRSARSDVSVPGRSGVIPGRGRFEALAAELEFFLHAPDGEQMEALYSQFRQGWSGKVPSTLTVDADRPLGPFHADLLLGQPIAGVPVDMRTQTSTIVMLDVFGPSGLFRSSPLSGAGSVLVVNSGDEIIYPRLSYSGAGGVVTSPSGAVFTLPPAASPTVVDLDPRRLRLAGAFPEGVRPGESGEWVLPEGAVLVWEVLVADPWA